MNAIKLNYNDGKEFDRVHICFGREKREGRK
jgi:hypothetical protein